MQKIWYSTGKDKEATQEVTMATKATSGKLRKALDGLETFLNADSVDDAVSLAEHQKLRKALSLIESIESRLYMEGR